MELKEKAWSLNAAACSEPWHVDDGFVVYASTRNKARSIMVKQCLSEGFTDVGGNDFTYKNVPISRCNRFDKYLYRGEVLTLVRIQERQATEKHYAEADKLVVDNPNGFAYIKKGGYYYGPNHCGYTERLTDAGVYDIKEAARCVKGCGLRDHMFVIPIKIEEHNKMIEEKIAELKSKLINQ